jgi:GLPGLI family protein
MKYSFRSEVLKRNFLLDNYNTQAETQNIFPNLMKQLILFPLLFQLSLQLTKAQILDYQILAVYELHFQPDSTDSAYKIKTEPYHLYTGANQSLYISTYAWQLDSLVYEGHIDPNDVSAMERLLRMPQPSSREALLKTYRQGGMTVYNHVISLYVYEDATKLIWQIQAEQKTTEAGSVLTKATTSFRGPNYTAWFDENIPVSDGPYKFGGLPGLIIQIADDEQHYVFEAVKVVHFPKKQQIHIPYATHAKPITYQQFKELKEAYSTNPLAMLEMGGGFISEADKRKTKENIQQQKSRNNNRIERKPD